MTEICRTQHGLVFGLDESSGAVGVVSIGYMTWCHTMPHAEARDTIHKLKEALDAWQDRQDEALTGVDKSRYERGFADGQEHRSPSEAETVYLRGYMRGRRTPRR